MLFKLFYCSSFFVRVFAKKRKVYKNMLKVTEKEIINKNKNKTTTTTKKKKTKQTDFIFIFLYFSEKVNQAASDREK